MEDNNSQVTSMVLSAQKARLCLSGNRELLSSGMAGVVQVSFTCSEDWDGLQKTAVFSNGRCTVDIPESDWEDNVCTVPQQVLSCAGRTVAVGLYGTDGAQLVLPTIWCTLGRVEKGAVPACQVAMPPEAPLWAQLQQRLSEISPLTVQLSSNGDTLCADKTPAELYSAVQEGTSVCLLNEQGIRFSLTQATQSAASGSAFFASQRAKTIALS